MTSTYKKKLIEVALPLEAINEASKHEKSVPRKGHPATMHLWWARRPLAACRAILLAQLIDDPSSNLDEFPTHESQDIERKRLFELITSAVLWENSTNQSVLEAVHAEIKKSCGESLPVILDPFAGGGSIPLEAQRLGLDVVASDLNPVPVLINRALLEIPPKWRSRAPVNGDSNVASLNAWQGAQGLAADIQYYGEKIRNLAAERLADLYPNEDVDGVSMPAIAWIWSRTVLCPNPACQRQVPLMKSLWLSKKKSREAWMRPIVTEKGVHFEICNDPQGPELSGTVGRSGATCLCCNASVPLSYVREEGQAKRMHSMLLATVLDSGTGRHYVAASDTQSSAALVERPADVPDVELQGKTRQNIPGYGFTSFADLFTARQLQTLRYLEDLIGQVRQDIEEQALSAGMNPSDAVEYAADVSLYISFAMSKLSDWSSAFCSWISSIEGVRDTFARQAIPMVWDYVEINPFSSSVGNFLNHVKWVSAAVAQLPSIGKATVLQSDAAKLPDVGSVVVSTDPPYYNNISYSDLSDFFYVWLRRTVSTKFSNVTSTVLTPKTAELVAAPNRFDGDKKAAEQHFENGFNETFQGLIQMQDANFPMTIFYAYKQTETEGDDGSASTGWETMLSGLLKAGFMISATWPLRTEREGRTISIDANALASSIVLACRKRDPHASATDRRGFITALRLELPEALRKLQEGAIAPVDLSQAAIGPGMSVYSSFSRVVEVDGTDMTVRTALALISQVLSEVLSEQEDDFDTDTRFCVKWFEQYEWAEGPFGDAETLSRAVNAGVAAIARGGIIRTGGGKVALVRPEELPLAWNPETDDRISEWEVLMHVSRALVESGESEASKLLKKCAMRVNIESVKELTYQLYAICERKNWSKSGQIFNALGASWNDLSVKALRIDSLESNAQSMFSFNDDEI